MAINAMRTTSAVMLLCRTTMTRFCLMFFSFTYCCTLFGQVNIIDPNAAVAPDIDKCFGETVMEAVLQFTANGSNATVSVPMPTGVFYQPGSVALVAQTGGLTISQSNGATTNPVFTITKPGGSIGSGNEIRFSYRVRSNCTAIAGTLIFPIQVAFNSQVRVGELAADILEAELNLLSHPIQTAAIGIPVTVPIAIQNGGLGDTDHIVFSITETGMTTTQVTVAGFPATFLGLAGNTRSYQIPVAALSGGVLNNTETFIAMRTVVLQACVFSSSYSVNWGCEAALCQSPTPTGPGEFLLASGEPNVVVTSNVITPFNLCTNPVIDITFTNNGTGVVSAATAFSNVFRFGMNGANGWPTSNWMTTGITLNGAAVAHTPGMNGTPATINASQFTGVDPDGSGTGLSDVDGDGSFDDLLQGASITFRVTLKYTCPTACPAPNETASLTAGSTYTNQCGQSRSSTGITGLNFGSTATGSPELFYPASVLDGQQFHVQICLARDFSGANCSSNVLSLNLTLPDGVTATGIGTINGHAAVVTTMGNVATVSGVFTPGTTCFDLELSYTCPQSPLNFTYEAIYTCDAGCSCVQKWACGNFTILGADCNPCPDGGFTTKNVDVRRTTLGFTDHTGSTFINPASVPLSNLRKGMPCDEFRFTITNTMNGGSAGTVAFDNAYIEVAYNQLSGANLLDYVSGTFAYVDASTGNTFNNIPLPTPVVSVIGGRHIFLYNFTAFIATLPGGMMEAGDILTAFPVFRVRNNPGLTASPTQPVNPLITAFNLANAMGNPAPGGSPRFSCDAFAPELYLHNPRVFPLAVAGARSGCGTYQVSGFINHELTILEDEYPLEIRPLFRLNNVSVQIMNGDSYDPSVTPVLMVYGSSDDPWYTGAFNLPAPSISGTTLTWINPGNWPLHDLAGINQSITGYQLKFNLINSGCANSVNDGNLVTNWNYNRFGYGSNGCQIATASGPQSGTIGAGAPVHRLTNLTGAINGTKRVECFQVEVENTTADRESRFVWLAMEDNLSPMDIVSVKDITSGGPVSLPLLTYANGKWVKLATSMPGNSARLVEICVTYNECISNSMVVRQSWDCPAYPANPLLATCATQTITLNIYPRLSAIQGNFIATSPLPANMCELFVYDILVNSSQQADLLDPKARVILPAGMALEGNVQIEYPDNSGNFQNATPAINGQVVEVDLTDHPALNDTLPGTLNANLVAYPGGEDRRARVRFSVKTTCDFFSGDRVVYQPFAQSSCNGQAQGSGALFLSPRIRIVGAEPTYEGTFSINVGTNGVIEGCDPRRVFVSLQLSDLVAADGLPAATGSADTVFLSLPSVMDYVPSSFTCTTVPGANCPIFLGETIASDGRRVLKFKLPPNLMIPNGGVATLAFHFDLQPQQDIACTVNDKITGRIIAVYNDIFCPTTGMNCPVVRALAGEGETPVVLKKMELDLESFSIACNDLGQLQYTTRIRVKNTALAAGQSIEVEYYCLDAQGLVTTLIEIRTLTGPLAIGSLVTHTGSFAGCDPQNGVLVSIPLVKADGQFQCHCGPEARTSNNLPKCPGVTVTASALDVCDNETIALTATLSGAATGGTWSRIGLGTAGSFSSTTALTTVYTPSAADIAAGQVTLLFTTNDPTGTCPPGVDVVIVPIYPRPSVAASTLTVCANAFGSNMGTFNLPMADNLVDPQDVHAVTYHTTQANANNGASPLASPYTAANNTVLYARVVNAVTGCFRTTTLTLRVNPLPVANPASLAVCEQAPTGSGLGIFNLTLANATINNSIGITLSYHLTQTEALSGVNALGAIITSGSAVLYARVVNNATGCINTVAVTLTVRPSPVAYSGQLQACPSQFDGSQAVFTLSNANVQVTGGVGGLTVTYHQSLTHAQQGINALSNVYTAPTDDVWVRVTNGFGCFDVDQVQLVVLDDPEILAEGVDVRCFGGSDGRVSVAVLGGVLPYTYDWSHDGSETPDNDPQAIFGLAAGNYSVTVTDGNGCQSLDNVTLQQPATGLSAVVNGVTQVNCYGEATGAIQMTVTGGSAPYTYNWSSPAADVEDPINLPAGMYTVFVTDVMGCTATTSTTITQPTTPVAAVASVVNNALCSGTGTGVATVMASGGTPGYTYAWSNGQTTQQATGLVAGAYQVTVTDAQGCATVAAVFISNPANLVANITHQTPALCQGVGNGTATVTATGGTTPYTYLWSGGQITPVVTNLAAGVHSVTITDNQGCQVTATTNIAEPTLLTLSTVTTQPVSCAGATNGSGTVLAAGGTPNYTYTWPGNFVGATRNGLAAGNYLVTVTDANGCMAMTTVVIGSNGSLIINTLPDISVVCPGSLVPPIVLNATPFNPNIIFSWTGGTLAGLADGTSTGLSPQIPSFTAATAQGTYTITVTANLQGCIAVRTFNITIQDNIKPFFTNCPNGMIMVGNDPNLCSAKVNWTPPTAIDNCGGNVSVIQTMGLASGSVFSVGTHQIVYTANDGNGNTATCSFTIVVLDTQNPSITCPPQVIHRAANTGCNFTQTGTALDGTASDNCRIVSLTHNYAAAPSNQTLSGAVFLPGTTVVVWTATDQAGHTSSCSFSITVADKTAPTVTAGTCPANIVVNNDNGLCGASVNFTAPTFEDNCDGTLLTGTLSGLASGSVFPIGVSIVRYTYTDAAGNGLAVCEFTVTVNDAEAPQIACPSNITVRTDGTITGGPATLIGTGPCGVTLSYTAPVGTDNCPNPQTDLMSGFGAGANYYEYNGTYTHLWRVTDAAGNTVTCQFTITVEDPILPVIICPVNTTVSTDPGECTAAVTYALPLGTDNCPGYTIDLIQGPASGANFPIGNTTVMYEVEDDMGNTSSCSFVVTVIDNEAPQFLACPPNRPINASTGAANDCIGLVPNMLPEVVASDNCTSAAALAATAVQHPAAGTPFGGMHGATQTVIFTLTDAAGNTQTCTTVLTLTDDVAPAISCTPTTRTVDANANCTYQVSGTAFDPIWADNCAATLRHDYAPAPNSHTLAGAVFPIGTTVVVFTATDAGGNPVSCAITIVVEDNQPPVFVNCPTNITVNNMVDQCGANVVFSTPIVTDNCGAVVSLVAPSLPSGSLFPVGTSIVTFRAVDAAGNSDVCTFTITVRDVQMPKAICSDFTVNLNAAGTATITAANINGGSTDNCTPAGNLTLLASQTTFDCSDLGANFVTLSVTDAAENTNSCVATVTVHDVTPPVIMCPPNITNLVCGDPIPAPFTTAAAFETAGGSLSDNCTSNPNLVIHYSDFNNGLDICSADGVRTILRTYEITDQSGNANTCVQTIAYLEDTTPPVITTPAADLPCIGGCANGVIPPQVMDWLANRGGATAADACGTVTWINNFSAVAAQGLCSTSGTLAVTFTATDACGNVVQTTANICINITERIGVAKRVVSNALQADGSSIVTYELNVQNYGTVPLTHIQVEDNLMLAFPGPCTVTVLSLTSPDFVVNGAYTGSSDLQLLAGGMAGLLGNTLAVDGKGAVLLTIQVEDCTGTGSFNNLATAIGNTPGGMSVADISTNGADPDPDGDGNPSNNGAPTPVVFSPIPAIGVAKRVSEGPTLDADQNYVLTYEIRVKNYGNVNLSNVQVRDDLVATFGAASSWMLLSVQSEEFSVNTAYNGTTITTLLTGNDLLTVNNEGAIYIRLKVAPGGFEGPYLNTATASGISPDDFLLQDDSQDGSDPDPDGDNNPGNNNTLTPTVLPCFIGIICPIVVDTIRVDNDLGWCRALVNFPPAEAITCAGASASLIQFRFSGAGVAGFTNGVWYPGQPSGRMYQVGITQVQIRASIPGLPALGYSDTCTFHVQVFDKERPAIVCRDITVPVGANCEYILVPSRIDGGTTDNCTPSVGLIYEISLDNVTYVSSLTFGLADLVNTPITVWLRVTDAAGNSSTCTAEVNLEDNTAPAIICPPDQIVYAEPNLCVGKVPNLTGELTIDNCGQVDTVFQVPSPGVLFGTYHGDTLLVTLTVVDVQGNTSSCTVKLTLQDTIAPVFLNCPQPNIVVNTLPGMCGAFVNFTLPLATDNCELDQVTQTDLTGLNSGDMFPVGTTILEFTATDAAGNSTVCVLKVIVNDKTFPTVACPANKTVDATAGICGASVHQIAAIATDNCPDNSSVIYRLTNPQGQEWHSGLQNASGTTFDLGTTTVTYRVQDQPLLLITEVTQHLQAVAGGTSPVPAFITSGLPNGDFLEITNFGPAAMDVSCLNIERLHNGGSETFSVPRGQILAAGEVLTLHFGNGTDHPALHYFNVPGGANLPAGQPAAYVISHSGAVLDVVVLGSFNPVGQGTLATVQVGQWNGLLQNVQAGVVRTTHWDSNSAADFDLAEVCAGSSIGSLNPGLPAFPANGGLTALQSQLPNMATCSFTVTVRDNEFPQCGANGPATANTTLSGGQIFPGDCFESSLVLSGSGRIADLNIYTEGQSDAVGDLSFTLISPSGIEVDLASGICGFNDGWRLTFDSDTINQVALFCHALNIGGIYAPINSLEVLNGEPIAGVWKLRIGHSGTLSANLAALIRWRLNVQRRLPFLQNDVVLANSPGQCTAGYTWRHPVLFDNCDGGTMQMQLTRANGTLLVNQSVASNRWGKLHTYQFPVGVTTVTYLLTDAAGNQTECSFVVTVRDEEPPIIACPANLTIQLGPGACEATPALIPQTATDNCGITSITYAPAGPYPIGTTAVTMTATDAANNTRTCTFTVTVTEHMPTGTQLSCVGQINVVLGPDCTVEITPEMVLTGTNHRCYGNYVVTLHLAHGLPALDSSPFATLELASLEIIVMICNPQTGECCWGTVLVEQKEDPEFICPADTTISCFADISTSTTGLPIVTSCIPDEPIISYEDQIEEYDNCDDFPLIITRNWTVADVFGNASTCEQVIRIASFNLDDLVFPMNFDEFGATALHCADVAANPHLTHPDSTGYPILLDGANPFAGGNYCEASFLYTDEVFTICDGSYQILRTWKVLNPCEPVVPGVNPRVHVQSIQVLDEQAPVLTCPGNRVISSGPFACRGALVLPVPQLSDGCSSATYTISVGSGSLIFVNGLYVLSNLEEGIHYITYRAKDACGRKSQCTFTVTVEDQIEPIAICNEDLNISIGGQGLARVYAADIDEGSSDNCGISIIEVRRRITRDAACEPVAESYSDWGQFVDFNCCDAGKLVTIELRVTDYSGNSNICWLEVLVEDKIRPFCTAPHPTALDCDELPYDFNPADTIQLQGLFGNATGADNCFGTTTRELAPIVNLHDCGFGTLLRSFQAVDAQGNISTNTCQQLVTINEVHHYELKFPKDTESHCGTPNPDTLAYYTPGCDLMSVVVTDEFFEASGDECYKIFRKYRVLNWCEYDGTSLAVVVGRDEDCNGVPGDEAVWVLVRPNGLTYYDRDSVELNASPAALTKGTACDGITNPTGHWINSNIDINATKDPFTGNQNNTNNPNLGPNDNIRNIAPTGLWEYTQVIKVYDDTDPIIQVEQLAPFCSINNETCEGAVELAFRVEENCTPEDLTITVWADEFADDVLEGNVTDEALSGTYPDFVLSGTFPIGEHRFVIQVPDGCGNHAAADIAFEVVDCKAPAPVCINGLAAELMLTPPNTDADGDGDFDSGAITVLASDFLASTLEDCTGPIRYSIHKEAAVLAGTDVPAIDQQALVLTCEDLGTVVVRIYAWDSAFNPYAVQPDGAVGGANVDWCQTYILLQDNMFDLCNTGVGRIAGIITTEENEMVAGVAVNLSGSMSGNTATQAAGTYAFNNLPTGPQADFTVAPELDTLPLNGVSTFDLIVITRHILNVQLLDSPYKMIAADVNNDKKITTLDLIRLRRLILALDLSFTNNTSWRFVRADYVFPVPTNPWFEAFPEVYNVNDLPGEIGNASFIAVKIGDINLSAATSFTNLESRDTEGVYAFEVEDAQMEAGADYAVVFKASDFPTIHGYQGTLTFDPDLVELTALEYGVAKAEHFGMKYADQGQITTSWHAADAGVLSEEKLFTLHLRAKAKCLLSTVLGIGSQGTIAEAYPASGGVWDAGIRFSSGVLSKAKAILEQNSPNPFAQNTTIGFWLPQAYEEVTLTISDVRGRVVKTFRNSYGAGRQQVSLDAKELPPGVYFYTLEAGEFRATRSMVVQE